MSTRLSSARCSSTLRLCGNKERSLLSSVNSLRSAFHVLLIAHVHAGFQVGQPLYYDPVWTHCRYPLSMNVRGMHGEVVAPSKRVVFNTAATAVVYTLCSLINVRGCHRVICCSWKLLRHAEGIAASQFKPYLPFMEITGAASD